MPFGTRFIAEPLYAMQKKEKPPHVQAHFILLVPHKIKRAFSFPVLYDTISNICQ